MMHCTSGLISGCGLWRRKIKGNIFSLKSDSSGGRSSPRAFEERAARSASPSLLSATVGQKLLSRLDDGSGSTSPERVITLWTEEGIRNSRHILQTLDFSLEERLSLVELTLALDNELLVSGNGIHQAALISYKNEIHYLQMLADQACRERDKAKADLEWADRRNLQLVREVDDRHATMESLNESKIKDLEQDFREKLTAMRSQTEQEGEVLLQQLEGERSRLQEEVQALQARDATRLEEVSQTAQENVRLEEEVSGLKGRLAEAEGTVTRLQRDLEHLLQDKFGGLDQGQSGLAHQEERFSEIIKEYEVQCRELRDRNDELSSEVEMLRTQQGSVRKSRRSRDSPSLSPSHSWATRRGLTTEYDSDDPEMKKAGSPQAKKKLQVDDKNVLGSLERLTPSVSIETELAMEQLKEKYEQEVQDLKIQLETQVNFYERSMELMRNNMEVERKDISQSFKVEISELEEQKVLAEERATKLKQALDKMEAQLQQQGSGAWGSDQERRLQRERAELEQNFAREMGNIVQRLTSEKDQLEAELKLKMDQEVLLVRAKLDEVHSENGALRDRLTMLQQDVTSLEDDVDRKRRRLDELEREHEKKREEEEQLHKENAKYREEVLDLSSRNLALSSENAELSSRLRSDQGAVQMLTERLAQVCREQEAEKASARQQQEEAGQQQRERAQLQASWTMEKELLERELSTAKEKIQQLSEVESELSSLTLKQQWLQQDKERLLKEAEDNNHKVEKLQESLRAVDVQAEQLRSQLQAASQERHAHGQEVTSLQRTLQESQDKVSELEVSMAALCREKEDLQRARRQHENQATRALEEECQRLLTHNQSLLHKVSQLQAQEREMQKLTQECLTLKHKQTQLETATMEAKDKALRADTALSLAQAQHTRAVHEMREQAGSREQMAPIQAQLAEQQRRGQQLEEMLRSQAQKASAQLALQQEQYEKVMGHMQERMEEVEAKLKSVRLMLQEKVNQLKEQLTKNAKSDLLLKDLYVENSQLMKALQITEQRQKSAEKKSFLLEEKVAALNKLLRKMAPVSLSA